MQISQTLTDKLKAQAAMLYQAHSHIFGLSLWAKTHGWKGTHEWTGDLALDIRKDVKGTLKFLADYGGVQIEIPAISECACKAMNLPDVYGQVMKDVQAAQVGWQNIAAEAEGTGETAVDDFADRFLRDGTGMIKRLTRWMNWFDQVGDDKAAWYTFDKQRRR